VQESGRKSEQVWKRSIQIIFIGVFIDLFIWQINPFATYDVLYLIGLSSIIVWYLGRLKSNFVKCSISLLIFCIHLFFLSFYQFEMSDIPISEFPRAYSFNGTLKRLFLDGWFPIFPWLGISFLGYLSFAHRSFFESRKNNYLFFGILSLLLFPFSILFGAPIQAIRGGYVELFYPVKNWFYFHLLGIFTIIIWGYSLKFDSLKLIRRIGSFSLSIYLFHAIYIHYILSLFKQKPLAFSWSILLIQLGSLIFCVFLLSWILNRYGKRLKTGKLKWIGFLIGL
jgi:uncharacterized membrane protein